MLQVAGKEVGPIGFGLMGLTWRANPCPQEQAFETMRTALKNGCTWPTSRSWRADRQVVLTIYYQGLILAALGNLWNGGEFYGTPDYNSLVLLERYFEKYPEDADKVVICIKGGVNPTTHQTDGSPENTRRSINDSIAQLKGRKKMELFEFARRDQKVPMEVTFDVVNKEFVQTGKIGGISLSEVRAETIHEAVKHVKVHSVEVELSL